MHNLCCCQNQCSLSPTEIINTDARLTQMKSVFTLKLLSSIRTTEIQQNELSLLCLSCHCPQATRWASSWKWFDPLLRLCSPVRGQPTSIPPQPPEEVRSHFHLQNCRQVHPLSMRPLLLPFSHQAGKAPWLEEVPFCYICQGNFMSWFDLSLSKIYYMTTSYSLLGHFSWSTFSFHLSIFR